MLSPLFICYDIICPKVHFCSMHLVCFCGNPAFSGCLLIKIHVPLWIPTVEAYFTAKPHSDKGVPSHEWLNCISECQYCMLVFVFIMQGSRACWVPRCVWVSHRILYPTKCSLFALFVCMFCLFCWKEYVLDRFYTWGSGSFYFRLIMLL